MRTHPNASIALGTGSLGTLIVWLLGNVFHFQVSAEEGAAIASGVIAVLLFVGRRGIRGTLAAIWNGTDPRS